MAKQQRTSRYREDLLDTPEWLKKKKCPHRDKFMSGERIRPKNITGREKLADLVDETFLAYNGARLKEGCQLFAKKMLAPDVTIGMSFAGALTPAGLGCSSIVPLIKAGFVDWIVATGANLYHDMHFALNYPVRVGNFKFDDTELRNNDIVRVYDVLLGYSDCLMATDEILRDILIQPEFQKEMGTAELHHLIGKYCAEWERKAGLKDVSVLAAAYRAGVPCYTSSPGDSTIGMNFAGVELRGNKLRVNPSIDVNESTAIVLAAKSEKLHAPDRAANPGSAPHQGIRPGLFLPGDRCSARHRRSLRRHAERSGELGQSGSGSSARRRGVLHRHDHRDATADALRAGPAQAAPVETPLRPAPEDGEGVDEGILRPQQSEDD
jgi:deoxyhypusine synthase